MKTKRFATEGEAREFAAAVDSLAGLPTYGVNVGGGKHADRELSMTRYLSEYVFDEKAADGEKYAYLVDASVEALSDKTATVDGKVVEIDLADVKDDFEYKKAVKS